MHSGYEIPRSVLPPKRLRHMSDSSDLGYSSDTGSSLPKWPDFISIEGHLHCHESALFPEEVGSAIIHVEECIEDLLNPLESPSIVPYSEGSVSRREPGIADLFDENHVPTLQPTTPDKHSSAFSIVPRTPSPQNHENIPSAGGNPLTIDRDPTGISATKVLRRLDENIEAAEPVAAHQQQKAAPCHQPQLLSHSLHEHKSVPMQQLPIPSSLPTTFQSQPTPLSFLPTSPPSPLPDSPSLPFISNSQPPEAPALPNSPSPRLFSQSQPPPSSLLPISPSVPRISQSQPSLSSLLSASPPAPRISQSQPPASLLQSASPPAPRISQSQPPASLLQSASPPAPQISQSQPPASLLQSASPPAPRISQSQPPPSSLQSASPSLARFSQSQPPPFSLQSASSSAPQISQSQPPPSSLQSASPRVTQPELLPQLPVLGSPPPATVPGGRRSRRQIYLSMEDALIDQFGSTLSGDAFLFYGLQDDDDVDSSQEVPMWEEESDEARSSSEESEDARVPGGSRPAGSCARANYEHVVPGWDREE
ncbi:PREDICTED: leucine-rich repeat extensin-like protein 5 [Priapulus caudatus]|uniref:Leucine-rich repeat extensin-like protein 5 n=1 Tax=Priapulus caudatus TaxID=37621 RepID=A0ABM1EWG3_PRICU|nr:PREDICTED: leucine-rich repeat extensin-like protein 5 [Priapulus caudatus]